MADSTMFFEAVDEGPQCYFEYEINQKRIILIGEKHYTHDARKRLPKKALAAYCVGLNRFLNTDNQHFDPTILLEATQKTHLLKGFIKLFHTAIPSKVRVQNIDPRDVSYTLNQLTNFVIRTQRKSMALQKVEPLSLKQERLIEYMQNLLVADPSKLVCADFIEILVHHYNHMSRFLKTQTKERKPFLYSICEKYFEEISKFKKYMKQYTNQDKLDLKQLIVNIIKMSHSEKVISVLDDILLAYYFYVFDFELVAELQKNIASDKGNPIIVIAGKEHILKLHQYYVETYKPILSVNETGRDVVITPDALSKMLQSTSPAPLPKEKQDSPLSA